jgi:rhodanese-related sulfurtransferase
MKSLQDLLNEANAVVTAVTADEAKAIFEGGEAIFIDLREAGERERNGVIPGAVHVPRGLLEWALDQDTTQSVEAFETGQQVVLFCSHGLRSAMSAQLAQEMGAKNVVHLKDGFNAWKSAGGPFEAITG